MFYTVYVYFHTASWLFSVLSFLSNHIQVTYDTGHKGKTKQKQKHITILNF